jgi:hypothetical protein
MHLIHEASWLEKLFGCLVLLLEEPLYIAGPTLSTFSSKYGFQSSLCPK